MDIISLRRRPLAITAILASLAWTIPAFAQDDLALRPLGALLNMEVSGASKFPVSLSDTAAAATVITSEQIRAFGYQTLGDVLRSVRGVVVSTDRTYTYLGIRGLSIPGDYNTRVLLLVDGNRVNDTVYDQAFLGSEFPLDLDVVDRVEFIPGQGSAVHGANALYGVVNVVTKKASANSPTELSATLAQGNSRRVRVGQGLSLPNGANILLSASTLRMAGTDARYAPESAGEGERISSRTDHERNSKLFAKYAYGELTASFIYGDRIKGLTNQAGSVFGDPRSQYRDTEALLDVSLSRRFNDTDRWKLRAYAGSYDFTGDYAIGSATLPILNRDTAHSRWLGLEGNAFIERFDDHKLVLGGDAMLSPRRDQSNFDVAPAVTYLDDHRQTSRISAFVEDQWSPAKSLTITVGARYDKARDAGGAFSPRLAAVWRAGDELSLKAIHGSAYRPPNAYEAYYTTSSGYRGNPDLRSERVSGDELIAEVRPSSSDRWTLSTFRTRTDRLIVQTLDDASGQLVFSNAGSFDVRGVEAEYEHVWDGGAALRANVSSHGYGGASANDVSSASARRLGKLAASAPLAEATTLAWETVLVSRRGGVSGHGLSNLTLVRSFERKRARVSFSLLDVFDRTPAEPSGDSVLQLPPPGYGRSLRVKLELAF
jgi:iron complex outermembrane receptor protein